MPIVDGEVVTPATAMTAGLCPECGADLAELDVIAHRDGHWPDYKRGYLFNEDANVRAKMIDNFVKAQQKAAA